MVLGWEGEEMRFESSDSWHLWDIGVMVLLYGVLLKND